MSTATKPRVSRISPAGLAEGAIMHVDGLVKRFPVRRGWLETVRHPRRSEYALALDDVSFSVVPGEFFGLLGPNGAGKTTLFKILATLIEPDRGRAEVAGFDLSTEPARVRQVLTPVIASERSLAWRLTARENLDVFAGLHRLPARIARTRVDEVLEVVELTGTGRKLVGEFSSGMRQRLLIARALLASPRILLLDEPTRSLDPISARRFRQFLRDQITGTQGCTVLLATHNTEEALELCDRVAIMDRGRLLAMGSAAELSREAAADRFRIWTTDPDHPVLAALLERQVIGSVQRIDTATDGWDVIEIGIAGDHREMSRVLGFMVESGMAVARFERVTPSLADVIDHVLRCGAHDE
jgi:ABC-2 type transport system ATP-binding protein